MKFYSCNISNTLIEKENSPVLLYAVYLSGNPDWYTNSHSHPGLTEITYVASGKSRHIVNGTEYICCCGDIVIHLPDVVHAESLIDKESSVIYGIALKNFPVDKNFPVMLHSGRFSKQIEFCMKEIIMEITSSQFNHETAEKAYLELLLTYIFRSQSESTVDNVSLSRKVMNYIDNNYEKELSLEAIASQFFISHYHLAHTFKNETGISTNKYIMQKRIAEAYRMIITTNKSITDISAEVGYPNITYFSNLFKKITGIAPSKIKYIVKD